MNRAQLKYLLFALPLCGLALSISNIWNPYSYWYDEILSVVFTQFDLRKTIHHILADVHPPLYILTLWFWVRLFGDTELSTRGLSFILSSSAFVYLVLWTRNLPFIARAGALIFFATSWFYPYYAQETRSYGLLLLFTTILTTFFLDYQKSDRRFYGLLVVCVVTSLIHYFGLLLASVVMVWVSLSQLRRPGRFLLCVGVGLSLLVWPIVHYRYGALGQASGASFWNRIDGPIATLQTFLGALVPVPAVVRHPAIATVVVLCLALLNCYVNNPVVNAAFGNHRKELLKLAFACVATVGVAAIVDLHTAVSTQRNYSVLLPAVSILVGLMASVFGQHAGLRPLVIALLVLWGSYSLYWSFVSMSDKWKPLQNWRDSARYLIDHGRPGVSYYYLPPYGFSGYFQDATFNYYVRRYSRDAIVVQEIRIEDLGNARPPFEILFGQASDELIKGALSRLAGNPAVRVFYPPQHLPTSTGVILSHP